MADDKRIEVCIQLHHFYAGLYDRILAKYSDAISNGAPHKYRVHLTRALCGARKFRDECMSIIKSLANGDDK